MKPIQFCQAVLACGLLLCRSLAGQQSADYTLQEHTLNEGGNPQGGTITSSTSFKITVDAVGDGIVARNLTSASYRIDAGYNSGYPPPGEATNLRFSGKTALSWAPEKSVGAYNLYRGDITDLPGGGSGTCLQAHLAGESASDSADPLPGQVYFYLVTAKNKLEEEGTKGYASTGSERANPIPCP